MTKPSPDRGRSRRSHARLIVALITLAILVGVVSLALVLILSRPAIHPSGNVYTPTKTPSSWREVQDGRGHAAHLRGVRPIACADCHEIAAGTFHPPDATRCAKCHAEVHPTIHQSPSAPPETRECLTCHAFVASKDTPAGPWGCIRCHDKQQGSFGAVAVHAKEACGGCHKPHGTPSLDSTPCTGCHRTQTTRHGSREGAAVSLCLDCHQPHEKAGAADGKCVTCHVVDRAGPAGRDRAAPIVPVTALSAGKHDRCTGCHKPHQFTRDQVVACRDCHANKITIGQFTARPHADCKSCHKPHDPRGAVGASCQNCHAKLHPSHPSDPAKGACLGCHDVHPKQLQASVARPCSSCHQKATTDTGFHLGGTACVACHEPHAFKAAAPDTCRTCHAAEARTTAGGGHGACAGCHQPHDPKAKPKDCANCHAPQGTLTAANKGHQTCMGCHKDPHAPRKSIVGCRTCHADQAASAPTGHAKCADCHEPHRGGVGATSAPPEAVCAKCHADRTTGPHRAVKGACMTCHRPHGPGGVAKPPGCTTCHDQKALPALHQKAHHATCASCHTSHGGPRGDRTSCTTGCHTDRTNHEPGAQTCIGCHNFRGKK